MKNLLRIAAFTSVMSAIGWSWQAGDPTPIDPLHRDGAHSGIGQYPRCVHCGGPLGRLRRHDQPVEGERGRPGEQRADFVPQAELRVLGIAALQRLDRAHALGAGNVPGEAVEPLVSMRRHGEKQAGYGSEHGADVAHGHANDGAPATSWNPEGVPATSTEAEGACHGLSPVRATSCCCYRLPDDVCHEAGTST